MLDSLDAPSEGEGVSKGGPPIQSPAKEEGAGRPNPAVESTGTALAVGGLAATGDGEERADEDASGSLFSSQVDEANYSEFPVYRMRSEEELMVGKPTSADSPYFTEAAVQGFHLLAILKEGCAAALSSLQNVRASVQMLLESEI